MAHQIPFGELDRVTSGDLVTWKKSLPDYPAGDGWVLTYALTVAGTQITFTSTADGDNHLVSVSAATSAGWTAGTYALQGYATNASTSERYQVFEGDILIRPNLATLSGGLDNRGHVKTTLDALKTAMASLAAGTMSSTSVLGTSYTRKNMMSELIPAISHYESLYRHEQNAERLRKGMKARGRIVTRFTKPT